MSTTQEFKHQLIVSARMIAEENIQAPILMHFNLPMVTDPIEEAHRVPAHSLLVSQTDNQMADRYLGKNIHKVCEEVNVLTSLEKDLAFPSSDEDINIWPFIYNKKRFYYVCEYSQTTRRFKSWVYDGNFVFNGIGRMFSKTILQLEKVTSR